MTCQKILGNVRMIHFCDGMQMNYTPIYVNMHKLLKILTLKFSMILEENIMQILKTHIKLHFVLFVILCTCLCVCIDIKIDLKI